MITGLRRSSLYVPGDNEKMLRKSAGIAADLLLLNLEDGVALSRKDEARENVARALRDLDFGAREIVVRVNSMASEVGKRDLSAVVPRRPDGICLPKVESAGEIRAADTAVLEIELAHGLPEGQIKFHAMIESARGLLHAPEIASASDRMAAFIFGSADYVRDVRCQPGEDREELLLALQQIVLAARGAGIDAIDAPCFDIRNRELLEREARQARRLGFDGKNALHPDQVVTINQIFSVTAQEIAWARKVLEELNAAEQRGRALSTLDGQLIDNPHLALAERILSQARLIDSKGIQRETNDKSRPYDE
ncbi:MAG: citrate lyase subunit beta [Acidobacteria bacterium]|nr:MAG: citrate lyase subunit beta [Acidobacteriota bacterium]